MRCSILGEEGAHQKRPFGQRLLPQQFRRIAARRVERRRRRRQRRHARRRVGVRRASLVVVEERTNGSVLSDAVTHLPRVDPQRQLFGQCPTQLSQRQSRQSGRACDQRVHLVVDSEAAVGRTSGRLLRVPVVVVVVQKGSDQLRVELHEHVGRHVVAGVPTDQVLDEIDGRLDFLAHRSIVVTSRHAHSRTANQPTHAPRERLKHVTAHVWEMHAHSAVGAVLGVSRAQSDRFKCLRVL